MNRAWRALRPFLCSGQKDESYFQEEAAMKDGKYPNPNTIHPIAGYDKEIYVKPTITNPNNLASFQPDSSEKLLHSLSRLLRALPLEQIIGPQHDD